MSCRKILLEVNQACSVSNEFQSGGAVRQAVSICKFKVLAFLEIKKELSLMAMTVIKVGFV